MKILITSIALSLALAACAPTPVAVPPPSSNAATCAALSADMPVQYHGNTTDADTVARVRRANARYRVVCPS
jgi:hypothetical protein